MCIYYRYINVTIGGEFKHLPDPYSRIQDLRKVWIGGNMLFTKPAKFLCLHTYNNVVAT